MNNIQSRIDLVKQQKALYDKIFNKKDNTWKIMIFDQYNLDIVSSLFKLKDFRQNNVTLYFNINQQRQQIHGVTVIYVIKPIQQNINLVIHDFQDDLYSSVILHFSSEPSPHLLSTFAKNISQKKSAVSKIQKVQYSNIGFQCIDRQMAILPQDAEFLNILKVLRNQPIFIYAPSQQQRVNRLRQKLSQQVFGSRKNQQQQNLNIKKAKKYTKVLIFNRQNDIYPVVGHGITYASLMQDICKFNKSGTKLLDKKQQIDLNDEIWLQRKNMMISEMQLQKELSIIKGKIMSLNNKMQQFSQLPQKQKKVQWHLDNAQQIIKKATQRRLNQYHSIQQDLYIKKMLSGQNKKQLIQLLSSSKQQKDKIRLMLSYLSCVQNYDQNQFQELESHFQDIKKSNYYNQMKSRKMKNQSQQNINSKYIKKLAKGIWKNLVNQEKKYLVVKYLQKTKDLSQKNINQLGLRISSLQQLPSNPKIQYSLIYSIGGICFNQYANIMQFDPNVIYAGDKFINYRQFL